jgi:DNA-binding CsgD family transcriptional regulator
MNAYSSAQTQFMTRYLDGFQLHFNDVIAAIKNTESRYIAASDKFAQLVGLENDHDLFPNIAEFADIYKRQDELIVETAKSMIFLSINQFATVHAGFLVVKKPIIDPQSDMVLGIRMVMHRPYVPHLLPLIFKTNKIAFKTISNIESDEIIDQLTLKQRMVLFLFIYRFSNAQISDIMSKIGHTMSISRVNAHLASLREALEVKSKNELIEKALQLNINSLVPKEFFKPGIYEIKKSEIHLI